jgi:hypothetical protein
MDSKKKNMTDRIFRSSLRSFRQEPPERIWNGITESLDADRRKRRMAWIGRIAATGALILAAGSTWILLHRGPAQEVVNSGSVVKSESRETSSAESNQAGISAGEGQGNPGESAEGAPAAESTGAPEPLQASLEPEQESAADRSLDREGPMEPVHGIYRVRFGNGAVGKDYPLALNTGVMASPEEAVGIDVFEEFGEPGQAGANKWAVGGQVSPLYSYRNLENVSDASSSAGTYNNLEGGLLSYAGGVSVNFSPARRLSIQSGVYVSRMGITIDNAALAQNTAAGFNSDFPPVLLAVSNSTGQIEMRPGESNSILARLLSKQDYYAVPNEIAGNRQDQDVRPGELIQHFEYLEVPLILRYRVVDRRVGLNLLGGLSSNFLVGNRVYFEEDGSREYIGRTNDIRTVNYGSIVGLGLQYSVSRNLSLNMEPTFRYYLNSINTLPGVGSHPYSLGFFTGIFYSF